MKLKLNENHRAEWTYYNCSADTNLYEGKLITYRESKRYGYRYTIVMLNDKFYIVQSLYTPITNTESISVYLTNSVNDAKAVIEAMIQLNKTYHQPAPEHVDA